MSDSELARLHAAREAFAKLVQDVRPQLLRYCSRMLGSTIEGEDVVQDALARAFYELAQLQELPSLRAWLFRIAHNLALNALVARGRRREDPPPEADIAAEEPTADVILEQRDAMGLAVGRFLVLPPAQRAAVIFKDVLGLSLEEIGDALGLSVAAVKAALHRGRVGLRASQAVVAQRPRHDAAFVRYAALFNARDWDGVRSMLAKDVELDLVGRGPKSVGTYFSNYAGLTFFMAPAWMDGRAVLAVSEEPAGMPRYVIELEVVEGTVVRIRDFVHARHVVDEATFELESDDTAPSR